MIATLFAGVRRLSLRVTGRAPNRKYRKHKQDRDAHAITSDAALLDLLRLFIGKCLETTIGIFPTDRLHERVHVACGLGAEVHVIGMLIHIER